MTEVKKTSLVIPTLDTQYHIDFEWWGNNDREWRVYLRSLLCPEHQAAFADVTLDEIVDWVDPNTAEVQRVDGLQNILLSHCTHQEDFLHEHTSLVESIFRLFMKNGNVPMSISEIAEHLDRKPIPILKILSGARVYRGLRPAIN